MQPLTPLLGQHFARAKVRIDKRQHLQPFALGEHPGDMPPQIFGQGIEIIARMQWNIVVDLEVVPVIGVKAQ